MAELNGRRLTTMLAANTTFQIRTDGTTFLSCHTNQLSYTILV